MTQDGKRINTSELAARWGMTVNALERWRARSIGPRYIKLGKWRGARVLYLVSDIEQFEKRKMVNTNG